MVGVRKNNMLGAFVQMIASLVCMFNAGFSFAGDDLEFKQDVDYRVLSKPYESGKGKVIEFFSYGCVFCYLAEESVRDFSEGLPENYSFETVAVTFGRKKYEAYAYAYHIKEALDLGYDYHKYLFQLVRTPTSAEKDMYKKLETLDKVKKFYLNHGVNKDTLDKVVKEIDEAGLVENGDRIASTQKVTGTPTFIVDGRYMVEGYDSGLGAGKRLIRLLDFLVKK